MRAWLYLLLFATAQPAWAGDAPYYGPMKRWHGIGFKFGYEDRIEKDGSWRIDAAVHNGGDAIDLALYRAAEKARDEGFPYLFLLGGNGSRAPGNDAVTIYARPSHDAVAPAGCRSRKPGTCYTADVAEILRVLGGPDGRQPGTPIIHHIDERGRAVFLSGYGTGAIAALTPGVRVGSAMTTIDGRVKITGSTTAIPEAAPPTPPVHVVVANSAKSADFPAAAITPVTQPVVASSRAATLQAADERFQRELKANQPIRGRDPKQGWTISD